ncbi:MAG: class I SAM-dependent methyltransferase [Chloroflexi bacterium]|nr:class I SAM-dependent methyltransferase [Chloroflexota bacterium]
MKDTETKARKTLHQNEAAFFSSYYEGRHYNQVGWRLRLERELFSLLNQAGTQQLGRVLSLGCGDGQFELLLARYAEQVIGLDLSPEAIASANQTARRLGVENVSFHCMPLEDLEWSDTYDVIVCLAILHHVPPVDVPGLLESVSKHLIPGGLFYSQDPNRRGVLRSIGRIILGRNYDRFHSPDERELDPLELLGQLQSSGFETVHVGFIDLTLIPALFVLPNGPDWPMYLMLWADWIWCHSPLARWASGFFASARRGN